MAAPDELTREYSFADNPEQQRFVFSRTRFAFYVGGIGAGKSFAGALRAFRAAWLQPGSLGLVAAPTYTMLRDTTAKMLLEVIPEGLIAERNKNENRLVLANGSEILFRSLDRPDKVRGLNLNWFWMDEAPLCGYYAWQILKGRLRLKNFPACGWATGTPKGKDGFYHDFELAPLPGHQLYRASTYANRRNLAAGYIEDLERTYTHEFFEQEVLGAFTAFEGLVYRFEADPHAANTHVRVPPAALLRPPQPGQGHSARVVGGIDWGYVHPCVALPFAFDGDGRAWQLDEFYAQHAGIDEVVVPRVVEMTRRYGVQVWWCDPEQPEYLDKLRVALGHAGLHNCQVRKANKEVVPGIQTVASLLALRADGTRGLYTHPRCTNTIREYGLYQYDTKQLQLRSPSERPRKENDDCLDATRYALHSEVGRRLASQRRLVALDGLLARQRGVATGETAVTANTSPTGPVLPTRQRGTGDSGGGRGIAGADSEPLKVGSPATDWY